MNYPKTIYNIATLTTNRVWIEYKGGKLFLDESIYGSKIDYEIDRNADSDLQASGYKKNVAKFIINNVNFTVIAHKGKAFAKSLNYVEV